MGPILAPQGWIVGEIKTFAVGADSSDLIDQLAKQGWVEAAGQSAIRKDFDELWKIMGADWGAADTTNVFFLPDLRGLILRSWNHSKAAPHGYEQSPYGGEPKASLDAREVPRPEISTSVGLQGATGNHVGSVEPDLVGSHTHKYARNANSYHLANDDHVAQNIWGDWNNNADTGPAGGPETRPMNAYVMYFIYVGKPAQVIEPNESDKGDPQKRTGQIKCYKDTAGRCRTSLPK